jgi:uncharacterized protein (TIGR03066 family)
MQAIASSDSALYTANSFVVSTRRCPMRTNLWIAIPFVVAAALQAAPVPKERLTTAEQLVGIWKLTKSDSENAGGYTFTVEFSKDGKMKAQYVFNDSTQTIEGKFKAEGNKIEYTLGDRGETLTIEKITDGELIVIDPEKKKEEFERVKAKKE